MLVLLAALAGFGYTLRTSAIFACPAAGYGGDRYLAYCHAVQYGDYDHGAFWYSLEPGIRDHVRNAQVLFLGNSRVQFGFSAPVTHQWMSAAGASHFVMGFAYWENYTFERALLEQIQPAPRLYVINMDDFFETRETEVGKSVMSGELRNHYRVKRAWQWPHRMLCGTFASLCGSNEAFFRSLGTGDYQRFAGETERFPVAYDDGVDHRIVGDYAPRATAFLDSLKANRHCVLITIVPSSHTRIGTAAALAAKLGVRFIAPRGEDLTTFDRSHLDADSAQRWAGDFFAAAGPHIHECLAAGAHAS